MCGCGDKNLKVRVGHFHWSVDMIYIDMVDMFDNNLENDHSSSYILKHNTVRSP